MQHPDRQDMAEQGHERSDPHSNISSDPDAEGPDRRQETNRTQFQARLSRASSESTLPEMDLGPVPDEVMADTPIQGVEAVPAPVDEGSHINQPVRAIRQLPPVCTTATYPEFRSPHSDADEEEGWGVLQVSSSPPEWSPDDTRGRILPAQPRNRSGGFGQRSAGSTDTLPDLRRNSDSSLPRLKSSRCLPGMLHVLPPDGSDGWAESDDAMSDDEYDSSDAGSPVDHNVIQDETGSVWEAPKIGVRPGTGAHRSSDASMQNVYDQDTVSSRSLSAVHTDQSICSALEGPLQDDADGDSICSEIRVRPLGNPHLQGHQTASDAADDVLESIEVDQHSAYPDDSDNPDFIIDTRDEPLRGHTVQQLRRQSSIPRIPLAHQAKRAYLRQWDAWPKSSLGDVVDAALTCTARGKEREAISYSQKHVYPREKWDASTTGVSYDEMREVYMARRTELLSCANSHWPIQNMVELDDARAKRQAAGEDEDAETARVQALRQTMVYWPHRQVETIFPDDAVDASSANESPVVVAEGAALPRRTAPTLAGRPPRMPDSQAARDTETGSETAITCALPQPTNSQVTPSTFGPYDRRAILDRLSKGDYTDPPLSVIHATLSTCADGTARRNFRGLFPLDAYVSQLGPYRQANGISEDSMREEIADTWAGVKRVNKDPGVMLAKRGILGNPTGIIEYLHSRQQEDTRRGGSSRTIFHGNSILEELIDGEEEEQGAEDSIVCAILPQ